MCDKFQQKLKTDFQRLHKLYVIWHIILQSADDKNRKRKRDLPQKQQQIKYPNDDEDEDADDRRQNNLP